jgi:uncharacterized protein (DUF2147 family)
MNPMVGDVGTVVSVDTLGNLSGATELNILVTKPDGNNVTWSGVADGTNIKYTVGEGDLDVEGKYVIRSQVVTPAGAWTGHATSFTVDGYD